MPWNNQSGSNGDGQGPIRGPWGRGSSGGGGGGQPPDLEELLRRGQDRLRRMLPGSGFTAGSILIVALGLIVVWLFSGIYIVSPSEQGVVLRFGQYVARTGPGINYHLPWPIETVYTPNVTHRNQIDIGYKPSTESGDNGPIEDVPEESLMLTGDENIVDVNFTVYWMVKDAEPYLFNVDNPPDNPDQTIKAVAESAMREVVGQSEIESIMTQDREPVQIRVRELMQQTLDRYGAGVTVTSVDMLNAGPPAEVTDAYRDVQAARADQERLRNEAEGYANKIIPEARGNASKIVQGAEAYRQQAIAEAEGEAKQFLSVYEQYRNAPDVTRRRMYLETMSQVLKPMNKIILDQSVGKGVVPYLPLPSLERSRPESVTVTAPSSQASAAPSGAQQ